MYYPDGDQTGNPRMINRQASFDSAVLTEDTGLIRSLPIDGDKTNLASYDPVVLTEDSGVIRGLPIDDDK